MSAIKFVLSSTYFTFNNIIYKYMVPLRGHLFHQLLLM